MIVITAYFNPLRSPYKEINCTTFLGSISRQIDTLNSGRRLIIGECVYGDELRGGMPGGPVYHNHREDHYVFRSKSRLWHREAIINAIVADLKDDFIWVDCDLLFERRDWLKEAEKKLETCDLIQPWSLAHFLDFNGKIADSWPSFGLGCEYGRVPKWWYSTGFAWGMKYETWKAVGGLPDYHIVGGADHHFSSAAINEPCKFKYAEKKVNLDSAAWSSTIKKVGCIAGTIKHLWHGSQEARQLSTRIQILEEAGFDPEKHLVRNKYGLWDWNSDQSGELEKRVNGFFRRRDSEVKIF